MLRERLSENLSSAIRAAQSAGRLPQILSDSVELSDPKSVEHGDFATNYALIQSKAAGIAPRKLAEILVEELRNDPLFSAIEIAGPGFINFRIKTSAIAEQVEEVLSKSSAFGSTERSSPRRMNVEFVSVNPNGPVTVGSGRGAAFGDTLCRVLKASGNAVDAEFYINDALNSEQMRLFAESVRFYLGEDEGVEMEFPDKGYKGEYVKEVALALKGHGTANATMPIHDLQDVAQDMMVSRQREDLLEFKVKFDRWFSEQTLHINKDVERAIDAVVAGGNADREPYREERIHEGKNVEVKRVPQEEGALWLRSCKFGDEKDRVLVRSDGRPAYIAGDLAYLQNKLGDRKYDKAILIVGPDHHGYIGRLMAACQALGFERDRFEVLIFQIVRFVKDGNPAPMRKRDGNIYELRDLTRELGSDAARFFYLMRSHDTHMDFDIDLATKQSDENPVFYVQYAHARISSVIAKASEFGWSETSWKESYAGLLEHPRELTLIKKIAQLPEEIARCAEDYGVHRLTTFATELSRTYHAFYDACRVLQADEPELSQARLCLCAAARIALRSTLDLLGVSAPERMDRQPPPDAPHA